jgi:predicted metalloprotease
MHKRGEEEYPTPLKHKETCMKTTIPFRSFRFLLFLIALVAVTAILAPQPKSVEASSPQGDWESLEELIDFAVRDIDRFWYVEMRHAGYGAYYYFPGINPSNGLPSYTPSTSTINLGVDFLDDQFIRLGDFAPVMIIAHEWGHHMQNILGLYRTRTSFQLEQQADCFAGGYAQSAAQRGLLENGDWAEAIKSLQEAGMTSYKTHGTPQQRAQAFNHGFRYGIGACFQY